VDDVLAGGFSGRPTRRLRARVRRDEVLARQPRSQAAVFLMELSILGVQTAGPNRFGPMPDAISDERVAAW